MLWSLCLLASRANRCVSTSSPEAEYAAIGNCVKEAIFIRGVLSFTKPRTEGHRISAHEDKEGAICLANNPLSSARSRHEDVRHHSLRELVDKQYIRIEHVETNLQPADVLTKPLEISY